MANLLSSPFMVAAIIGSVVVLVGAARGWWN